MGDTPVPSPQPASSPVPPSFDSLIGQEEDKTKDISQKLLGAYKSNQPPGLPEKQLRADRAKMEQAHDAEGYIVGDEKKFHWDADKEMAFRSHSPMEEFGSLATLFSIVASSFTHTPLTNSLNAAASYMNAVKAGDEASYTKAYKAFEDNTKLALKRAEIEHRMFEEANTFLTTDMATWRARTAAAAAQFQNKKMQILLESGRDPEVLKMQDAAIKAKEGLYENFEKIQESNAKLNYISENMKKLPKEEQTWTNHAKITADYEKMQAEAKRPNYGMFGGAPTQEKEIERRVAERMADPKNTKTRSEIYDDETRKVKEAHQTPLSAAQEHKEAAFIKQYDYADSLIDNIISSVQDRIGAVGTAGYINRAAEAFGNILGSDETHRKQIERWIEELQIMAPQLLLDQQRRPLSSEAAKISSIIGGMRPGDTTANVMTNMQDLQDQLRRIRSDKAGRMSRTGAGDPSIAAPVNAKPPGFDEQYPLK